MSDRRGVARPLIGLAGLVAFTLVVVVSLAQYNQVFTSYVGVTVRADRTGLLMDPGAKVKLNGVHVGTVGSVETTGSGVTLTLRLDPAMTGKIPASVSADMVPPTVFGAKYVSLVPGVGSGSIQQDAVISSRNVTSEVNTTFDALLTSLQAIEPARLNAMLNSVANALQGRGSQVGDLIRETNAYLNQLNPSLPKLTEALPEVSDVSDDYSQVAPGLVNTLGNVGDFSDTMVRERGQLNAFLLSFTRLGNHGTAFLSENGKAVETTLDYLQPTVQLLREYSPEFPCLLGGVERNSELLSAVMGGPEMGGTHRGAHVTLSVQSDSQPAYEYPGDLPVVGAHTGPDCHGLPVVDGVSPRVHYNTGANPFPAKKDGFQISEVPLSTLLFGGQQRVTVPGGGR